MTIQSGKILCQHRTFPAINHRVLHIVFCLAALTISFDIFLSFDFLGFTLRAPIFFEFLFIVIGLGIFITSGRITLPPGLLFLTSFALLNALFLLNAPPPFARALGIALLVFFMILLIVVTCQVYRQGQAILGMLKFYVLSFAFVSAFGIVQFGAGAVGVDILVNTWWLVGRFPRANGFSYEPSYYATYLLLGWVFVGVLLQQRAMLLPRNVLWLVLGLISLAILASGSKVGLGLILIVLAAYIAYSTKEVLGGAKFRLSRIVGSSILIFAVIFFIITAGSNMSTFGYLLTGSGLFGSGDFSFAIRLEEIYETLDVWLAHPVVGVSLGGVGGAIAVAKGQTHLVPWHENTDINGNNVFAEALAGTGVIGLALLIAYFAVLFSRSFLLSRHTDPLSASILRALAWSLVVELLALQANQFLMRPYLWLHVAILSATIVWVRRGLGAQVSATRPALVTT